MRNSPRTSVQSSRGGAGKPLAGALVAVALAAPAAAQVSYLDNGTIRLGVDMGYGGVVTFLRDNVDQRNLVNNFDRGRHIQQSYYSGPAPYDPNNTQHPAYPNWPWNPVQAGDVYNNTSAIVAQTVSANEIYVKTRPLQWALDDVEAESHMETWYTLEGNVVKVRNRLTNFRADTNWYAARLQELPALYTVGTLPNLHTYTGDRPFTGGGTTTITNAGPPWANWYGTEGWAANLDADQFGLGVYHPDARRFTGGFAGTRGTGGPDNSPTGYISPLHQEIIDHDIVYDFSYDLIVGNLGQIRSHVYANQQDMRPETIFNGTRDHWHSNTPDAGVPDERGLRVNLQSTDPQVQGPWTAFRAQDVPRLYIEMAVHVNNPGAPGATRLAQLFWTAISSETSLSASFNAQQSLNFQVFTDGEYHVYELDMAAQAKWAGLIKQLRLDPVTSGAAGEHIYLRSISYRNPIPEPGSAAALLVAGLMLSRRRRAGRGA